MKPPTPPLPSQFRDAQTQQPQLVQERTLDPLEVAMDSEVTTAVIGKYALHVVENERRSWHCLAFELR